MKTLDSYIAKLPAARRANIEAGAKEKIAALHLQQARESRGMTQEATAKRIGISQASLSRLERRTDAHIGTVARYVSALGGTLEVRAVFPKGSGRRRIFSIC